MKGDFSRIPFDPAKHYAGVMHQQGRAWLDSDWNEDVAERLALLRQELRDLVGPCGVPSTSTFQIAASADARSDNFQISGGHGYVEGHLCAIEGNVSYLNQPDFPDAPRVNVPTDGSTLTTLIYLEVWQRLITYLEDDSIREVALGGPDTSARLKTVTQVRVVTIPNGIAKCADASPFLPHAGSGQLTTLQPAVTPALTACQLPDPANFTGRENNLYRVEVHDAGDLLGAPGGFAFTGLLAGDAAVGAATITLATALTSDQVAAANRSGFVTISDLTGTSERVGLAGVNPAGLVLTLGQPLANAYTAANKAAATGGVARFKWSRDNASFAASVTNVKADRVTITLASVGRDLATAFRQGDLVELSDDASELGPARGHLTFLKSDPDPDVLTVQLADALPPAFQLTGEVSTRHLVIRRWDGVSDASGAFDAASTPGMNLGDGVRVQFSGLDLRPGDYWQFAVRSADGSVQALTNADPHGIKRHRCPLGIFSWGPPPLTSPPSSLPAFTSIQDCRRVFPALIDFPHAEKGFHVNSVFVVNSANAQTPLLNDTDVRVDVFNGLDILCDAPPDPASVSRPSFYINADFPQISNSPTSVWYFPVNLAAVISVDTNKMLISWRLSKETQNSLSEMIQASPGERGVLARLTLKGQFIWALNNPNLFLDGKAFGQRLNATNNTSLQLPSGDGRRGGDFHMWFWIVAAPSFAKLIVVTPAQIYIGESATFTVTLSSSAPAVNNAALTSSNSAVAPVPPTVPVAVGATSFTFVSKGATAGVTTVSVTFPAPPPPAVTPPPTTTLTVLALPLLVGQIPITPPAINVAGTAFGFVTLNSPAPTGGALVTLVTSNAAIAVQPASVTVPAGATSQSFSIAGLAPGTATITATLTWPNGSTSNVSGNISVVRFKGKESFKDAKDREKLKDKEGHTDTFPQKAADKLIDSKTRDAAPGFGLSGSSILSGARSRSFIRPEERPAVEERVLGASRPEGVS